MRNDNGSITTERRTYWSSHLGPIVHRTPTLVFAMKSTRFDAFRYFEGFYRLSRATNLRAWFEAEDRDPYDSFPDRKSWID